MGIGSWFQKTKDKIVDDVIPNELKSGEKFKKTVRNLIPNEVADVAVKAAPFVAPFNPGIAAAMRGIGRFDQRGSISDALKQAAATAAFGNVAGMIPGTGNYFGKGLEGARALGSDALSGITSIFKGPTPGTNEIVKSMTGDAAIAEQIALESAGKKAVEEVAKKNLLQRGLGSLKDFGLEFFLGDDKKFQMGDIGKFLGDPGKTIPLTMLAAYIKEKFFPDKDTNSPDARYAQAMKRRGEDVEKYLREYGPQDFRRDPTVNPYSDEEIEDFVATNLSEYQGYEDGGRVKYAMGTDDKVKAAAGIEGLDININPKGIMELDMREEGGFIPPVGVKEKADDIPAMLSNNEFVFTADAVRAAGGGSVDKGAQRMYKMMKDLEAQV
jgi:hypothetical protein|tara:strand:+ start:783 stop:1931 length:1149 start_codon:yes stop_codon:yes gene_type:complete